MIRALPADLSLEVLQFVDAITHSYSIYVASTLLSFACLAAMEVARIFSVSVTRAAISLQAASDLRQRSLTLSRVAASASVRAASARVR